MRHDEDLIIVDFHCAKAMAKIPEYKDDFFEGTSGRVSNSGGKLGFIGMWSTT